MVKLLLDENLSYRLSLMVEPLFDGASHVSSHRLNTASDSHIWQFAKENHFIILTQDSDFHYMSIMAGCPPKVVQLRCGNKSKDYIASLVKSHAESIIRFAGSEDCYMEIW